MNIFAWKCVALLALALMATGCGPGGPRLYKARGTVTRNKQPVEGAQVTFAYTDGNFANGFTDAAGKFQLVYMNRPGGAPAGKCNVSVSKKPGGLGTSVPAILDTTPKSMEEQKAKMAAQQKQMQDFARRAEQDPSGAAGGGFTKSGYTFEITTDESKNNFDIVIKD